ncbi:hypothetical protein HHI36_011835 [Cryptolaemus montrouzieri]|uniref:Ferritin n=1 Tax=Cryptolaemus montrouzieri TaxID=559131 RepID=A0ABD2NDI4_9CUCU
MKSIVAFAFLAVVISAVSSELHCTVKRPNIPNDWIDMVRPCVEEMKKQIQKEINASMKYLAMGAHFSRDTVNRPGFAKYFFEAASEEREHAIKLIKYLLMRGELVSGVSKLIKTSFDALPTTHWNNAVAALEDALKTEAEVTKSIRNVISVCEEPNDNSRFNDYHLSDYLTGEFLEEQYKGQRDIAGKISNSRNLWATMVNLENSCSIKNCCKQCKIKYSRPQFV